MKFTVADNPLGTDIISLVDMKEFLRVDHTDEDTTISEIITSAAIAVQDYTGRVFVSTTYTLNLDYFHNTEIPAEIGSVTSVTYYDSANAQQTLDASKYYYDASREPARIAFLDPPSTFDDRFNAVTITGGMGKQAIPPIKHAIKMLAAHYYENRRAVIVGVKASKIPLGIEAILNPYRIISLV
jgi:uncharacterized phiE125 gp8 family phage protein